MFFNSLPFIFFFAVVFIFYYAFGSRIKPWFLLFSSIVFYLLASWQTIWNPILIIVCTYLLGSWIERSSHKKHILALGIFLFVLNLFIYKYLNFILDTNTSVLELFGYNFSFPYVDLMVPLGLSFMSFQAMGYLIDVSRGDVLAEKSFLHISNLILFFPKVISGPIEPSQKFLPQLKRKIQFDYSSVTDGLKLFFWGLLKKVVIADRLAVIVNAGFSNPENHQGLTILFVVILFSWQLYMDFSGYTDMAMGIAKVFGFNITQNFNRPFYSLSVTEFWRRWHISLSSWFRDYLFTPLSVSKRNWGKLGIIFSLITTFVLLGFWHGPTWGFVIFGLLQGLVMSIEFLTLKFRKKLIKKTPDWITRIFGMTYTFMFFSFSLVFFYTQKLNQAFAIFKNILVGIQKLFVPHTIAIKKTIENIDHINQSKGITVLEFTFAIVCLVVVELITYLHARRNIKNILAKRPVWIRFSLYYLLIMTIILGGYFQAVQGFLYAQF
jgi:alginate O-acetyltransferase complex protein AlgI